MIYIKPEGPPDARIMLVGECPWKDEVAEGRPFAGASGYELTTILRDAGIMRSECFITNVVRFKPDQDITDFITPVKRIGEERNYQLYDGFWVAPFVKEHIQTLLFEIDSVKPNVIVALGNTPLWALTGKTGITKWRGSQMQAKCGRKLVPVLHPAAILREYSWRATTVHDFKMRVIPESRVEEFNPPAYDFTIRPSFSQTATYLSRILEQLWSATRLKLAVDIETRRGQIACLGIGDSSRRAFCIPFMCTESPEGYWSLDEELAIVDMLRKILTHRNAWIIGQNFLYDSQYIINQWKFIPYVCQDTMVWHHTLFPGLQKGLDFLASMYADYYCYWKDEGKEWNLKVNEDALWHYNCLDCVYTYEVAEVLERSAVQLGQRTQVAFQQSLFYPALDMMLRGCGINMTRREEYSKQLEQAIINKQHEINYLVSHSFNPRSPVQMQRLFYEDFKQPKIMSRKTGAATLDAKALDKIVMREPLLKPLVDDISDLRSFGVFKSTFIEAELDADNRVRCSYNIAGPETFRWSSSQNAFGRGMNLQNIPATGSNPDVRRMFIPDPDYFLMDWDLDRADLQVVVWEADDSDMKQMLREGVDMHAENAKILLCSRQLAKTWVHGTNYGGSARTMAANCGITIHQSDTMRRRWFGAHPGIHEWHRRTERSLASTRSVSNAFGYRRLYFDRVDAILPEALAWVPQSTVAIVINIGLTRIFRDLPQIQLLLQVHDSLVMQAHKSIIPDCFPLIREALRVVVPYSDPLVIPVSGKGSFSSWGECGKLDSIVPLNVVH